jgi:UDP-N-acetylmuramoyl-tripeptide--D-alanyl-D-alanine ligase
VKLQLSRIAEFISATGQFDGNQCAAGYSIDSRTIKPGDLFFAVRGENLDGHDYVDAALQAGAIAAVVSSEQIARFGDPAKVLVVQSNDALPALQTLGAAVRRLWAKPLIAVTGSAGKTSTKDAIAHLLSRKYKVLSSHGNLNNHFGLPLQLLKLQPEHEIAVVEMGMSHAGEIAALAAIAKPDCGVVTCVGPAHLESFSSVADIARAKYELIQNVTRGGTAVLNCDDEYVSQFGRDFHGKVIFFGLKSVADVCAENVQETAAGSSFALVYDGQREPVELKLLGRHSIMNALAASACATAYGVSLSDCAHALGELTPGDKRGERLQLGGATIINDCYNSNPTALKSMVEALAKVTAKRRIVVAGEMLELGDQAEALHREAGEHIAAKADQLIGVRGLAKAMVEAAQEKGLNATFTETPEQAGEMLAKGLRPGDAVLLKASRGVKLERALETLKQKLG